MGSADQFFELAPPRTPPRHPDEHVVVGLGWGLVQVWLHVVVGLASFRSPVSQVVVLLVAVESWFNRPHKAGLDLLSLNPCKAA